MASQHHWPARILQDFTVRMACHGFSVSGTMMNDDNGYALEQLKHANSLEDDGLRELALELFRDFERQRSGVGCAG